MGWLSGPDPDPGSEQSTVSRILSGASPRAEEAGTEDKPIKS